MVSSSRVVGRASMLIVRLRQNNKGWCGASRRSLLKGLDSKQTNSALNRETELRVFKVPLNAFFFFLRSGREWDTVDRERFFMSQKKKRNVKK